MLTWRLLDRPASPAAREHMTLAVWQSHLVQARLMYGNGMR